jgi:hypothetical protein
MARANNLLGQTRINPATGTAYLWDGIQEIPVLSAPMIAAQLPHWQPYIFNAADFSTDLPTVHFTIAPPANVDYSYIVIGDLMILNLSCNPVGCTIDGACTYLKIKIPAGYTSQSNASCFAVGSSGGADINAWAAVTSGDQNVYVGVGNPTLVAHGWIMGSVVFTNVTLCLKVS